jgi:N-acetylglutamate synthase-like GNAT family acetyltransferase
MTSEDIRIRPASPRDAEGLHHVRPALSADTCRRMIEDPGTALAGTWVVESSGEVVGFAHFRDADERTGEVMHLHLLEDAWKTDAPRRMLDAVLDDMRVVGFGAAVLSVSEGDSRLIAFCEDAGLRWVEDDRTRGVVSYRIGL